MAIQFYFSFFLSFLIFFFFYAVLLLSAHRQFFYHKNLAFVPPQQRFPAQSFCALLFYILRGTGVFTSALVDLHPTSAALNLSSRAFHTPPARNVHSHDAEDRMALTLYSSVKHFVIPHYSSTLCCTIVVIADLCPSLLYSKLLKDQHIL